MESSALIYIFLTIAVTVLALFVRNADYVTDKIRGGREYGRPQYCDRQTARNRVCILAIYILLTAVSACRIAVGNDYWVYRKNFDLIAQDRHVSSEIGFNSIVKLFQWIFDPGKVQYVSIFAFFAILTVYFFVKALSDQADHFAFSVFLLMTGGYYFNSLNSVRYYFAVALALFAMKYVLRGDYLKFILCILPGAFIHKSILLTIPVYIVAKLLARVQLKKWHCMVGGILLASLIFGQKLYREIIFFFYPFYRNSEFDNGQISLVNILKCLLSVGLCVLLYKSGLKDNIKNKFYAYLNLFALVVYCCGSFIPETSRIGFYMLIPQIFLIPDLLDGIHYAWIKKVFRFAVVAGFGAYFALLLHGMYATDIRLLPYLNWIFN